jgi:hypothetical protein
VGRFHGLNDCIFVDSASSLRTAVGRLNLIGADIGAPDGDGVPSMTRREGEVCKLALTGGASADLPGSMTLQVFEQAEWFVELRLI